jgi:cell division protein ZapA
MNQEPVPVTVRILDKEFRVACQPEEQEELIASARLLDQNMREIRQTGRVIGIDRIAVMAALNIAHELIQLRSEKRSQDEEEDRRLYALQERIADTLATQRQLDAQGESV